jgi:hypothetical protein
MAAFYIVRPEVAGGLGERTECLHRPDGEFVVTRLHYEFQGWLGDELLEAFPCFIVTRRIAERFEAAGLSGFAIGEAEITVSEEFEELYPGRGIPSFVWLKVLAHPRTADLGVTRDKRLVVSERALNLLRTGQWMHAEVEALPDGISETPDDTRDRSVSGMTALLRPAADHLHGERAQRQREELRPSEPACREELLRRAGQARRAHPSV